MDCNIVNTTLHGLNFYTLEQVTDLGEKGYRLNAGEKPVLTVERSGLQVRLKERRKMLRPMTVSGVAMPVSRKRFRGVTGLPRWRKGVIYIVPSLVAERLPWWRRDVFCPGPAVRDADGVIVGAIGITRLK